MMLYRPLLLILCAFVWNQEDAWAAKLADKHKEQGMVVVRKGENLLDVAKRCGSTPDDLIKTNGLLKPYKIYIGQPLIFHKAVKNVTASQKLPEPADVKDPVKPQVKQVVSAGAPPKRDYYAEESAALGLKSQEATNPEANEQPTTSLAQGQPKAVEPKRTGKHFSWPVEGKILSAFGKKETGRKNDGINIAVKFQSAVKAAEDGVVVYAGNEIRGFGNVVLIKHGDGWSSVYAHNDMLLVAKGDQVKRGQDIAKSGNTGHVDAPQLHFELRHKAQPVDPMKYLK